MNLHIFLEIFTLTFFESNCLKWLCS